jgi:5-dehydro-2-deoxygluconokinase
VRRTFETLIASWRATRGVTSVQPTTASHAHQEQAA